MCLEGIMGDDEASREAETLIYLAPEGRGWGVGQRKGVPIRLALWL